MTTEEQIKSICKMYVERAERDMAKTIGYSFWHGYAAGQKSMANHILKVMKESGR